MSDPIVIYSDGSCYPNPGPGGYAYRALRLDGSVMCDRGGMMLATTTPPPTNNRAELTAVIRALEDFPGQPVRVRTDSMYVIHGADGGGLSRVANVDLWSQFDVVREGRVVLFEHVKGHSGVEHNEACDALAREYQKKAAVASGDYARPQAGPKSPRYSDIENAIKNADANQGNWNWKAADCPNCGSEKFGLAVLDHWKHRDKTSLVVKCKGGESEAEGCDTLEIHLAIAALDLEYMKSPDAPSICVAAYEYRDATGRLLYRVKRYWPKDFGFDRKTKGVARVLYRLPELVAAPRGCDVLILEGEKDTDAARADGHVAVCAPCGTDDNAWRDSFNEHLRGHPVQIVADRDKTGAGMRHAQRIAQSLRRTSHDASLTIGFMPGDYKDYSTWREANAAT